MTGSSRKVKFGSWEFFSNSSDFLIISSGVIIRMIDRQYEKDYLTFTTLSKKRICPNGPVSNIMAWHAIVKSESNQGNDSKRTPVKRKFPDERYCKDHYFRPAQDLSSFQNITLLNGMDFEGPTYKPSSGAPLQRYSPFPL